MECLWGLTDGLIVSAFGWYGILAGTLNWTVSSCETEMDDGKFFNHLTEIYTHTLTCAALEDMYKFYFEFYIWRMLNEKYIYCSCQAKYTVLCCFSEISQVCRCFCKISNKNMWFESYPLKWTLLLIMIIFLMGRGQPKIVLNEDFCSNT